jgi:hypothetical protein
MNDERSLPLSALHGNSIEDAPHELYQFMKQVSQEMRAEYDRIRARASEDPGTAGDEGEGNWAGLLREWLPVGYQVATKGRLLSTNGKASPQVDVVVLRPSYPPKLVSKKIYLAEGVAAAFETKLTLRAEHITKAVKTASSLRSLFERRDGSPYRELTSPLLYGILAHSHDWKDSGSDPGGNITSALIDADRRYCSHPREMLDLVCVADLATWSVLKTTGLGPALLGKHWPATQKLYGYPAKGGVGTTFVGPRVYSGRREQEPTPLGTMFTTVLHALAWEDRELRPIAEYFLRAGMSGMGEGNVRVWAWDVYTPDVRKKAEAGKLSTGLRWDEWGLGIY